MPQDGSRATAVQGGTIRLTLIVLLCALSNGCINVGVMVGKVLLGNPTQTSAFELQRGISLQEEDVEVAVICTAPTSVLSDFDGIEFDMQDEVARRMRLRNINVASDYEVSNAMNRTNGRFDEDRLAAALDGVDYIIHVEVGQFSHTEDGNPDLYRCRCNGMIYAYEVTRDPEKTARPRADKVFYQDFDTVYPTTQPITADRTSVRAFHQKCVDHLADLVGRTFYDVETAELIH